MSSAERSRSGPVLQLIASGLKLWIRSRCDSISDLQLDLHGSGFGLLRGRLEGVTLTARDVIFKGLPLQHADLRSGLIQIDLALLRPDRMLSLQESFEIEGEVAISGQGLNDVLLKDPWRWLGDWLADQLMGLSPLGSLRVDNDVLELHVPVAGLERPTVGRFRLQADEGTVAIRPLDDDSRTFVPMDPMIRIEEATLWAGLLTLKGEATVTP